VAISRRKEQSYKFYICLSVCLSSCLSVCQLHWLNLDVQECLSIFLHNFYAAHVQGFFSLDLLQQPRTSSGTIREKIKCAINRVLMGKVSIFSANIKRNMINIAFTKTWNLNHTCLVTEAQPGRKLHFNCILSIVVYIFRFQIVVVDHQPWTPLKCPHLEKEKKRPKTRDLIVVVKEDKGAMVVVGEEIDKEARSKEV